MIVRPEPLTRTAFLPFGEVLQTAGIEGKRINEGRTLSFPDLADVDVGPDGRLRVSIYRSTPVELPFEIRKMERHPLASQAFMPMHDRPFPVIVAVRGSALRPEDLRAFMTDGRQGFNLRPGTWHHYQLSLDLESEYLVLDRAPRPASPGENLEERPVVGRALLQV